MILVAACSSPERPEPVIRTVEVSRPIPEEAKRKCSRPVATPERALRAGEIVPLWNRDRLALRECENRRALAVGE